MPAGAYVLGHAEAELRRLGTQARLVDPITRGFLVAAGICEGMRVLDVGSGAGHTALLLAGLVGPTGEVVGADLSDTAVDTATRRAAEARVGNVSFRHGDPAAMAFDGPFDAVVGRYVLMFMPDPAASLARLARHLRPGGIVVFHEPDWDGARCSPPVPSFDLLCAWIREAFLRSGAQDRLGTRLAAVFAAAGLPRPTLALAATIGSGSAAADTVGLIADLAATLRPDMERLGIVAASEPEFAEVGARILAELGPNGTAVGRAEIGAWTRV